MTGDMQYLLMIGGVVMIMIFFFGVVIYVALSEFRSGGSRSSQQSSNDVTNMMILFQTMRDILTQQKDLAREFNISIDKKVNEVRKLVQSNGDVKSELERTKRELAALAARTRNELSALERRLGQVGTEVAEAEEEAAQPEPEPDPIDEDDFAEDDQAPPVEILPQEVESEDPADLIDRWTRGTDFDSDESEEEPAEETNGLSHEEEVESEETRAAYRDLLNLQPAGRANLAEAAEQLDANGSEPNRANYLTPIQQRVYEYSDAGMRVPEIARELGVGKGEVRLILSLRQDRDR